MRTTRSVHLARAGRYRSFKSMRALHESANRVPLVSVDQRAEEVVKLCRLVGRNQVLGAVHLDVET